MNNFIWDIVLLVIIAISIGFGIKKGFLKSLLLMVFNIVCVVMAFLGSDFTAESLYESYFMEDMVLSTESALRFFSVEDALNSYYQEKTIGMSLSKKEVEAVLNSGMNMNKKLDSFVSEFSGGRSSDEGLRDIIAVTFQEALVVEIPPCREKYFESIKASDTEEIVSIIDMMRNDKSNAAKYIEENYIRKDMIMYVRLMIFVPAVLILCTIVAVIFSIANKHNEDDTYTALSKCGGAFIGIFRGIIAAAIIAVFIKLLIYSGLTNQFLNDDIINSSHVYTYLYNIDKFVIK